MSNDIQNTDFASDVAGKSNTRFSSFSVNVEQLSADQFAEEFIRKLNSNFQSVEDGGSGGGEGGGTTITVDGPINVVTDFGVGNGVGDDQVKLEAAFAAAYDAKRPIYFPAGTYIIKRPLTLRSGMEIYGDGNSSIIRKKAARWHTITANMSVGDTVATLDSVDGFEVGDGMFILDYETRTASSRYYTHGVITAISGNQVTFEAWTNNTNAAGSGAIKAHKANSVLSTSFAVFRAWSKYECCNVCIHDLCLDGNRQADEPKSWCNACIHFEPYSTSTFSNVSYNSHSYNHIVANCRLINSSFDAISDQGEGGLIVKGCTISNSAMHGVHCGTTFNGALVLSNTMSGNNEKGSGVFWCQNVTNVIVSGNTISEFNHGCSDEEFGSAGKYSLIRDNTFINIVGNVFNFTRSGGAGMSVIGNTIRGLRREMFCGTGGLQDVIISENTVESISSSATSSTLDAVINITGCTNVIVTGNTLSSGVSLPSGSTAIKSTNATNVINNNNFGN